MILHVLIVFSFIEILPCRSVLNQNNVSVDPSYLISTPIYNLSSVVDPYYNNSNSGNTG
jgi:hypothetical protein